MAKKINVKEHSKVLFSRSKGLLILRCDDDELLDTFLEGIILAAEVLSDE